MKKSKNYLWAVRGLVVLIESFLLSVTNASHAQDTRSPQPVTVENARDRPVPVQGSVTIANRVRTCPDESCPAQTLNANDRKAFQKRVQFTIPPGVPGEEVSVPVPEGKRLVIEFVAAREFLPQLFQQPGGVVLRTILNGEEARFPLLATKQATVAGTDFTVWIADQQMRVYADPPGFRIEASRTPQGGTAEVDLSVSGYLVDL